MKKYYFFAFATAIVAFASCSSSDETTGNEDVTELTPSIKVGVGTPVSITESRGTGAVGETTLTEGETQNVWKAQIVNVYMVEKGTTKLAYFDENRRKSDNPIYESESFTTPTDATLNGLASPTNGIVKYYPVKGNFDFWGYRLDDCEKTVADAPIRKEESATSNNKISYNFTIDGSQDILAGKAKATADDLVKLNGNDTRAFSAYAARLDIHPNIMFKHLLTRLTFEIKAGKEPAAVTVDNPGGVWIDSVEIKALSKGNLVVAYTDGAKNKDGKTISSVNDQITFDTESTAPFYLKQRPSEDENVPLVKLEPITPIWDGTDVDPATGYCNKALKFGESLIVPAASEYDMVFYAKQIKDPTYIYDPASADPSDKAEIYNNKTIWYPLDVKLERTGGFLPGHSYKVTIVVNGLEDIKLFTTLDKWVEVSLEDLIPEDNVQ